MLFFLNGYITTWVGYVMPLVAYPIYKWDVNQFGWLMVGVSGTAAVGSFITSFFSKTTCMKTKGDWRTLLVCYFLMAVGIVLSYFGGPTVSFKSSTTSTSNSIAVIAVAVVVVVVVAAAAVISE